MALAYAFSLGQKLDYAVLIDGYNEALYPAVNVSAGIPYHYPSAIVFSPLLALASKGEANRRFVETYLSMLSRIKLRDRLYGLDFLRRTSLGKALARAAIASLDRSIASMYKDIYDFEKVDLRDSLYQVPYAKDEAVYQDGAKLWANSHVAMNSLALANGTRFLHFIQPNQYVSGHVFSEAEARVAFHSDQSQIESVRKGYAEILKEAERLKSGGAEVYALMDLFDQVAEPVYADNCCHYNKKGEEIFQEYIADAIGQDLKEK